MTDDGAGVLIIPSRRPSTDETMKPYAMQDDPGEARDA
jgi:hypothetical protein